MRLRVAIVGAAALAATVLAPQIAAANGTAWVIQSTRTPAMTGGAAFTAISCPTSTQCMGVGTGAIVGNGFAEKWNGTRWRPLAVSEPVGTTTSGLQDVSCTSRAACTAVGYYFTGSGAGTEFTLAERWNGTAWSVESSPSPGSSGPTLLGVSCPSASDCTAVGTYQAVPGGPNVTLAEQWNGVQWTVQSTPNPTAAGRWSQLTSVSCSASSTCTAVGYYVDSSNAEVMLAEQWNGVTWAIQPTPSPAGAPQTLLSGVSCQAAAACTAVGKQLTSTQTLTLAERWNGTIWATQSTPSGVFTGQFTGVSCPTPSACTAVGMYQIVSGMFVTLAEQWNGVTWAIESSPNPNRKLASLTGVSCVSATTCDAVGYSLNQKGVEFTLAERNAP
jgi:hypothetical protein